MTTFNPDEFPHSVTVPVYTRVNGREIEIGTITVPVRVESVIDPDDGHLIAILHVEDDES